MRSGVAHIVTGLLATVALVLAPADALWPLVPTGSMWAGGQAVDSGSDTIERLPLSDMSGAGSADVQGSGTVTVSVVILDPATGQTIPIFRFYSPKSGTHFYTPSAEERDMVIGRWPHIWSYEGVAYTVNTAKNSQPLYRFYNWRNGSHFYTASAAERDLVLSRWMNAYQYDGETYRVTPQADAGKTPVYRFFNVRNGSHFYTASSEERDIVLARWPHIYQLEGKAFWLGQ